MGKPTLKWLMRRIAKHEAAKEKKRRKAERSAALTDRQRLFIELYLVCGNATEAARRCGYKWPGKVGSQLANHPRIRPILETRAGLVVASRPGPLRCGLLAFDNTSAFA